MPRRPNILLITTDQERYDHLGLKGLTAVGTPNLDRLGTEGVHFDRAYTVHPTCTPARVTLLTGHYPSTHGAWSIGVTVDPFPRPTIADTFNAAGYDTAIFGKTHFVRRDDEARHVTGLPNPDVDVFREVDGPYLGFRYAQVSRGHTINQIPNMHYRAWLEDKGVDWEAWFPQTRAGYDHHRCGPWEIPAECHDTTWVSSNTEKWIRQHAEDDSPWLCWASFQDPHEPFVCPEPWYSSVDMSQIETFEGPRPGEFDDKPPFYGKAIQGNWNDWDDGCGVPSSFYTPERDERSRAALQATLGMVAFIDNRVGAILAALEETQQADNTVVIFTTDHGEMHGHHGFWGKGLTAYDDCQRIPLLIWGPSLIQARGTTQALANLVDLPCTMLSLAGLPIPPGMQGVNLAPILRGEQNQVRDWTIIECQATHRIYQQTFITDRYKLIVYRDDPHTGELYDMHEDPDQYQNLWSSPDCAWVKAQLLHQFVQANMMREGRQAPRQSFA